MKKGATNQMALVVGAFVFGAMFANVSFTSRATSAFDPEVAGFEAEKVLTQRGYRLSPETRLAAMRIASQNTFGDAPTSEGRHRVNSTKRNYELARFEDVDSTRPHNRGRIE